MNFRVCTVPDEGRPPLNTIDGVDTMRIVAISYGPTPQVIGFQVA